MTSEPAKTDYKSTICLPQTGFPMKANLPQREPEWLARWEAEGLEDALVARPGAHGDFILHDGPPYANGHLHVGHALNKVLKDIVVRSRTMMGFRSPYVPGWDCHGLPIEQKVGQELGPKRAQMSALEIRKRCEAYARKWVDVQRSEFKRMGVGGEWEKPYLTLEPRVEAGILRALADMVRGGYVYKGLKPVYWCASCQTALAEAEVEYEEHESPSIYVKFPVIGKENQNTHREDAKHAKGREEEQKQEKTYADVLGDLNNPSIVIWTTTPWTLPANVAVSLHPEFEYVALRVPTSGDVKDGRQDAGPTRTEDLIVAKGLIEQFQAATGLQGEVVRSGISGKDLEGLKLAHPVQPDRDSVVILGEHVTLEAGTGAVHTAPGHGMEDFIVGQKYGLPTVVPVDAAGRFTDEFGLMEGMSVWEANGPIVRYLDEKNVLLKHAPYKHSYPHCWRCHNPIIYRATEQWFMRVDHDGLRERTLAEIDEYVQWIPAWGRDRIYNMMEARPDWCLSRQRVWGVPIPAVVDKATGKAVLDALVIDRVIEVVREKGTDAWWEMPVEEFLPTEFVAENKGKEWDKEFNILDVWFDSGSTFLSVLEDAERGLRFPADLYLEGADQHRGWFHTSLLASMATRGRAPYKAVLTHGFVMDAKGEAMSKSRGNVVAPQDLIKKYGADIMRLWLASEDFRADLTASDQIFERVSESYRRVRNTLRYLLGNLSDFDEATDRVPYAELPEPDRWMLNELHELITEVRKAYETYEFHKVYYRVNQFCVVQLSSLYVDILKDRVYCSGAKSPERRAAQTVQWELASALVRLVAPILVFTADEAWRELQKQKTEDGRQKTENEKAEDRGQKTENLSSVHLEMMPEAKDEWRQAELGEEWKALLVARGVVMRALEDARQVKKAIGQSLEARVVVRTTDTTLRKVLAAKEDLLADLFIVSEARLALGEETVSSTIPAVSAEDLERRQKRAEAAHAEPPGELISQVEGERLLASVYRAPGAKCDRCWRRLPSVGADAEHPTLCDRCVDVIRRYY